MTFWLDDKGCGKCNNCGMDMDMAPFCVDKKTLQQAKERDGREYSFGLNINPARLICKGDNWVERSNS